MKHHPRQSWFSITAIIPHIILIALALGGYYYLAVNDLFSEWIKYIYYAVKIFVAIEIILAAGRSLLGPLLALIAGLLFLYASQVYYYTFISMADAWQLIIVAMVGFGITVLVRFL